MADEQDKAEALDPEVLGEEPGDHGLPGINIHAGPDAEPATGMRLVEQESDVPTLDDSEGDAVAEGFVPQDGELSAEESAMHLE